MKRLIFALLFWVVPVASFAAVGCDLNDPDRDVSRLFPDSTGYKTAYYSIKTVGGEALLKRVESRLGDTFHGLYETIDVPYTVYEVHKGPSILGYVHGVNEKGEYGGIQVFLALGTNGVIRSFYIQKLTSKAARELRSRSFGSQFVGLSLTNFPSAAIKNPAPGAGMDYEHVLRAVKKNLILMDEFVFSAKKP
jgi:hypothetical protein